MKKPTMILFLMVVAMGLIGPNALAGRVRPPANDDLAAATAISALPFVDTVDLRSATLEPEETQPACRGIRSSVWYSLSLQQEETLVIRLSGTAATALSIVQQTPDDMAEVACTSTDVSAPLELRATAGGTYLVQVGSAGKRRGTATVDLSLSTWKEVSLVDETFAHESDEQNIPILSVKGGPRATNPSMYDVTVQAWQQPAQTLGVLTFGLVTHRFEANLIRIPPSATAVHLKITGRYDSSQYACAVDQGETCHAAVPFHDAAWLSSGDAQRAELVVTVTAERDGQVIFERSHSVPYAGQALGMLP